MNLTEIDRMFPLGANIDPPDPRDYDLAELFTAPGDASPSGRKSWMWNGQDVLNQGREGACVLFGTATALNCRRRKRRITDDQAMSAYGFVTENDAVPGTWRTGQSGSYPRDGAEYWRSKGLFVSYAFTRDVALINDFLLNEGPVCLSTDWLVSMDQIGADGFVRVDYSRGVRGRHLYCVSGVDLSGRGERHYEVTNTWGEDYGRSGKVKLSEAGLIELFRRNANNQAMTFVEKKATRKRRP